MHSTDPIVLRVLRWVFGAFYLFSGIHMALVLLGALPMPPFKLSPASAEFQMALAKTGFVIPILAAVYIVSGASLLFYRTAPLGISTRRATTAWKRPCRGVGSW